ncbi:hypothetical protein BTN49_0831 [Candidatus Enterovibrio escicola]|uniref:Uncharacterized protein n=1 Tax=Candidatus Enterovibrio escicola TaxID=1927127 RepID=A0A2A5T6Y8_9GAMM|nr:hypothetical protein BTN49_0831 [Candidatus Enterovibrio escacola]
MELVYFSLLFKAGVTYSNECDDGEVLDKKKKKITFPPWD